MNRRLLLAAVLAVAMAVQSLAQEFQLLPAHQVDAIRMLLPPHEIESVMLDNFDDIIRSDDMIWYTKTVMPPAYQIGFGFQGNIGPLTIGDIMRNISDDIGEGQKLDGQGGNANIDFPWGPTPGGAMQSEGRVRDVKGIYLPRVTAKQAAKYGLTEGDRWPIVLTVEALADPFATRFAGANYEDENQPKDTGLTWTFPVDTVFVEVLMMRDRKGRDAVFEIRTRFRETGEWGVDIFRPFGRPVHLANAIKDRRPNWKDHSNLVRLIADLENKNKATKDVTIRDSHVGGLRAFELKADADVLPPVDDDDLVFELLARAGFDSELGQQWRKGVTVPTTMADSSHVVPKGYHGMFVGNDRESCMECHKHAGRVPARVFDPQKGWYGFVRGSATEGILSFHPWEPEVYKGKARLDDGSGLSAFNAEERQQLAQRFGVVRRQGGTNADINLDLIRKAFLDEGIVEVYNRQRHPVQVYHRGVPDDIETP